MFSFGIVAIISEAGGRKKLFLPPFFVKKKIKKTLFSAAAAIYFPGLDFDLIFYFTFVVCFGRFLFLFFFLAPLFGLSQKCRKNFDGRWIFSKVRKGETQHSTVVAFALHTQWSKVQALAFLKYFPGINWLRCSALSGSEQCINFLVHRAHLVRTWG